MPIQEADLLEVQCGRCGKPMTVSLNDIKGKRVIDCEACERKAAKITTLVRTKTIHERLR